MTADSHPASLSPDWLIRARLSTPVPTVSEPIVAQFAARPGPSPLVVDIHEGLEVGIMLVGTAERHFQDFVLPGLPGDVWLCAMWEPHGRRVVSPHTENVVLQFIPEFLGEEIIGGHSWLSLFAVPPRDRPWVAAPETREETLMIGRRLKREIQRRPHFWQYSVRLHLLRLLFLLSRSWSPAAASAHVGGLPGASLLRIMPALNLLRDPRRPRVTLAEAAAACRLSPSRFAVVFPRIMGVSFGKFALRARLAFAAHRLLSTNLSVDAIAAEAGFTDASHLHRHFVRHYGQTPRSYREQPSAPDVAGATPFSRD
jgi:AraC-like DNA-binding protein